MPKLKVPMPPMDLPFVGESKEKTSYSMANTNNRSVNIYDADEENGSNRRSKSEGFVDEPARHKRTWEEKEKEESFELEEDLYSLLYLADPCSLTSVVCVLVFLLQMFILTLIFADVTYGAPVYPEVVFFPLEVPVQIEPVVAVAQFISLIVATIKEEDIFVSLKALIIVGHDERVSVRFPGATPFKWWLANSLRFLTGILNVVVSFYFIVGSDSVLSIFESFAAVEFVSYIDNMVFRLAKWGYIGKILQRMTIRVESVQMENRREKGRWWAVLAIVFLGLTFVPLLSCWAKVRIAQLDGFYLEQSISPSVVVEFGDESLKIPRTNIFDLDGTSRDLTSFDTANPPRLQYGYFSGNYEIFKQDGKLFRYNDRPIYVERDSSKGLSDPAFSVFYFCEGTSTWVYTIPAMGSALRQTDVCEYGWLAQSEKTDAYSLDDMSGTWNVWTGVISDSPVTITSDSCELASDCSLNGICEDGVCQCEGSWQGHHCDIEAPFCPSLAFVNYGQSSYDYSFEGPFELLLSPNDGTATLVYRRPVYYRKRSVEPSICPSGNQYEIYLYAGRRWFLSYWCEEDLKRYVVDGEFRMEENLHAYWDNVLGLELKWFSELTDSYTGRGLQMYEVRDSYARGSQDSYGIYIVSQGSFECMDVPCKDDADVCGRKGTCEEYVFQSRIDDSTKTFHKCTCADFYGGIYCQFNPYESYTKDHFIEFQSNATDGSLEPSTNEYQWRYWEPLIAAGANFSAIPVPNDGDQVVFETGTGAVAPNEPAVSNNSTGSSNIFNQSATGEGEL